MVLELKGLGKTFPGQGPGQEVHALENIDLALAPGRFLCLVGPSGCGKTTLLRIIAGLERASRGQVLLDGRPLEGGSPAVGLVFQEYALFPWRTTVENIEAGLEFKGVDARTRRQAALRYVRAFGLEGFEHRYPRELSGGMQQRVAIARTLIMEPRLVLMDEPFGSLDSQTRSELQNFLLDIWRSRNDTVIFVTHNVEEAVFLGDEIVVLSPRPGTIRARIAIETPRPRDRTGPESNRYRRQVLDILEQERRSGPGFSPLPVQEEVS